MKKITAALACVLLAFCLNGNIVFAGNDAFEITTQPVNYTGELGGMATFNVGASGNSLSYQWEVKTSANAEWKNTGMNGAKTNRLSVDIIESRKNYQFRCLVSNGTESVYSDVVRFVIPENFGITSQPVNYTGVLGGMATFNVGASGNNLSYQWQVKTSANAEWKNTGMNGAKTNRLSVDIIESRKNYQFRCLVSNGMESVYSDVVHFIINSSGSGSTSSLEITSQPQDFTGYVGEVAPFSVKVNKNNATFQWEVKTSSGAAWKNTKISGYNTNCLSVDVSQARLAYKFRCLVTSGSESVYSNAVGLFLKEVSDTLSIDRQPVNYNGNVGELASFTVDAKGKNLTYQWQMQTDTSADWTNTSLSGSKTNCLIVEITNARKNYRFRCIVSDGVNELCSDVVNFLIGSASETLAITTQPVDFTGETGNKATFIVSATGSNLSYQWEVKTSDSAEWKNTGMNGAQTNRLIVDILESRINYKFRCRISDGTQSIYSDVVRFIIPEDIKITNQPVDYTGETGSIAIFTVSTSGRNLSYQWEVKTSDSAEWKNTGMNGAKTNQLGVDILESRKNYLFRCHIFNDTQSAYSDVVRFIIQNHSERSSVLIEPPSMDPV